MTTKKNKADKLSLFNKLSKKDRLVVVDLDTYEEIRHFNFSALNIIVYTLLFGLFIIAITWSVIAYTPVKQNIPGYPDITLQKELAFSDKKNIEWIVEQQEKLNNEHIYYKDLKTILSDSIVSDSISKLTLEDSVNYKNFKFETSKEDSVLRKKIEAQEKYKIINTGTDNNSIQYKSLKGLLFFPPINGVVSDSIDTKNGHFGVDIKAPKDEAVKATLGGTVIYADWTPDNGNVIQIQHNNDLVSVYKHNSVLLKKVGDIVKTGEAIAIIGNSGKLSTGSHLHLEIWHKGIPIDPLNHIIF